MDRLALVLGGVLLALYFAAEPILRRGRGRSLTTGEFERGSTALVTTLGLLSIVAALLARAGMACGRFAPSPATVAALALVMTGAIALRCWAMATLGEYFSRTLRVLGDQAVVTRGPYRLIRHPGYLAQLAVLIAGSALLSLNGPVTVLIAAALGAAYAYRIRTEERMLVTTLGAAYARYARRTWRLVPWVY